MSRSSVDVMLAELGARMGMAGLRLDEAGACQLLFDQRWLLTLWLPAGGGRLVLHCPVTAAVQTERLGVAALLALLEGSFLGRGAGGGRFSVAPDRRVCLQLELPLADANAGVLFNAIEQMLLVAESWAARLEREPTDPAAPQARTHAVPAMDLMARRV